MVKDKDKFVRQQYGKVGKQAVVKICTWTKNFIRKGDCCYKHHFYGISTGRCLEMSPTLICNQRCKHCWRDQDLLIKESGFDEPKEIIENCLKERERLLIGFKGNKKIDLNRFEECLKPKQAAISLTGEPCLYPKLPELVKEFYKQGFESVFLVTNGTCPEMLKKLGKLARPPTNTYLSVEAWDEKSYQDFCKPVNRNQYEKIKSSLEILAKLKKKTNTVLRITCIRHFNMDLPERFKWLIETMQPTYIECKGYMFVGQSRKRMKQENMPDHEEVKTFAEKLARLTGYQIKNEQKESWVVLLSKN